MRAAARRVGFVAALVLMDVTSAPAGQPGPVRSTQMVPGRDRPPVVRVGTAVLKGRVVDGATGAGVPRARVTIQGAASGRPPATTDGTGGFTFTNLPAGEVMLQVEKSTFLQARYPQPGRTLRSSRGGLVLVDGQVLEDVTVPIFHGCAILGRVLDVNGDPVEFAQINVLRVPAPGRSGRPTPRGGSQSNDLGEFRVGRLEPGTYLLQVTPRRTQPDQMRPPDTPAPQPMSTYYPSATAADQAQPITLERGQSVSDIDVVLSEGLPAVITGVVTGLDGQPVAGNGHVNARQVQREGMWGGDGAGTGIRQDGTFRFTLAPGEWLIEARVNPGGAAQRGPDTDLQGTVKISVAGGGEEIVSIAVGRGASVTGRVVFEGGPAPAAPAGQAHVPLFSPDGQCRGRPVTVAPDWTFRADGLFGPCALQPMAGFGRWMVKAVIYNGDNLLDAPYTFQQGQQLRNVQVIVTDRRSDITFRVADENGQSTRDTSPFFIPSTKHSGARRSVS
jgi:hypothetical protein